MLSQIGSGNEKEGKSFSIYLINKNNMKGLSYNNFCYSRLNYENKQHKVSSTEITMQPK